MASRGMTIVVTHFAWLKKNCRYITSSRSELLLLSKHSSPIIIIGAARSGTKMLRAALATAPELAAFRFDINYIWKYRNYDIPHDELAVEDLTVSICRFIRARFRKLLLKSNSRRVLEKTVSNSLRVKFVRAVFPESKIIHIYRDGRDVAADARLCWESSMFSDRIQTKGDLCHKIIDFPLSAAWPYLLNYFSANTARLLTKKKQLKSWGPRFKGIDDAIEKQSLLQVCGMQWNRSIELSIDQLSGLKYGHDYISVRYEDLVQSPVQELRKIADFIHIEDFAPIEEYAKKNITTRYVGLWEKALSSEELKALLPYIDRHLHILGYD